MNQEKTAPEQEKALVPANSQATEFEVFHLDTDPLLKEVWVEREQRRQLMLECEKWIEGADELIAQRVGDAGRLFLEGAEVAVWINDGTFKKKQFTEMYPEIAEECSEWQRVLSLPKLKAEYPEVYKANRARTMRVKQKPVIPS